MSNSAKLVQVICVAFVVNTLFILYLYFLVYALWCLGENIGHSFIRNFIVIAISWLGVPVILEKYGAFSKIIKFLDLDK